MLDVESGSLWWYNQPPAEPAFLLKPRSLLPFRAFATPPPLNRIYVYNIYSHQSFLPSPFYFSLLPQSLGEIYALLPHVVATAAEAEKESD